MIEEERISKVNQRIEKGLSYIPENVRSHIPIGHLSYHQEVGAAISDATTPQISDPLASPTQAPIPTTISEPVAPVAEPVPSAPVIEPVPSTPVVEPVSSIPVVQPVPSTPVVEPVTSAPVNTPEVSVPVSEPATPISPVAPVTPPVEVNPYENQTHSEILTDPATTVEECNLVCFDECLKLKNYVSFPVIKQCIQVRCHCNLDTGVEKLKEYLSLNSMDTFSSVSTNSAKPSFFTHFMLTIFILTIMGGGAFVLFKYIKDRESLKRAYFKDDIEYTQENGYEPMRDQLFVNQY